MRAKYPEGRIVYDESDPKRSFLQLQEWVNGLIKILNEGGLSFGVVVDGGAFTAGQEKRLLHGLGRLPKTVVPSAPVGGYGSFQILSMDEQGVNVQAENAVTSSDFWVY